MVYYIVSFLFILFGVISPTPDFVDDFHKVDSKKLELNYIKTYQNSTSPCIKGYVVSLKMKQSKYEFLPWKKLSIFKQEKNNLEQLINQNPKNIHLRYVRLLVQEQLPSILGYSNDIVNDKEFLKLKLKELDSVDYLDTYILKNTSL